MSSSTSGSGIHLRLVWPQWQGAGTSSIHEFAGDIPHEDLRRGYAVGTTLLEAVLPSHDGPTATVPVAMGARRSPRPGVWSTTSGGRRRSWR